MNATGCWNRGSRYWQSSRREILLREHRVASNFPYALAATVGNRVTLTLSMPAIVRPFTRPPNDKSNDFNS